MIGLLFPGQGSHRGGMASVWSRHPAYATFDEVGRATGMDLARLADDPEACTSTAVAQPAVYAASITAWRALTDAGVEPGGGGGPSLRGGAAAGGAAGVVAGHSLGEVAAAVASGALDVADGARLVAERGRAMGAACAASPGGMAAVLGMDDDKLEELRRRLGTGATVANDNAPGQVVLSGDEQALTRAVEHARELGAVVKPLDVEGAFHSPAMSPAVVAVTTLLNRTPRRDPQVPFVSGATGGVLADGDAVARALGEGVLAPVRWRLVQQRLVELGVTRAFEVGPGGVLRGLARRAMRDVTVDVIDSPEQVQSFTEQQEEPAWA